MPLERVQYLTARLMSFLPARAQVWLSHEPPLVVDGKTFDAQAQLLRALRRRNVPYGLIEPTVEAGRKRYRYETRVFRGPVTPVDEVRHFEIPAPGRPMRVRHYANRASRDLMIYLHGGGYVIGDLDTHDEPCRILCRHATVGVLSVEYRLAPENPFPAALEDARLALAWTLAHAGELGARRISIGGDSAGANLATVTCLEAQDRPAAQLLIYPPVDATTTRPSRRDFGKGFMLTSRDGEAFQRLYLAGAPAEDPRISPLLAPDLSRMPPALVVTAGFDLLRDEGRAYAEALRAAGVTVRTREADSLAHGFIHMTGICRAARDAMIAIARDWRELLDGVRDSGFGIRDS